MSATPRVSVLVPVHNCERYLAAALRSILDQTFSDLELIAIDDGSTDGSLAILREHARADARVRVVSRPNTGIAGALNDGLAACRGELVARMDGDDISLPRRLAEQVRFMDAHPECIATGTRVRLIDPDGAPLRDWSTETEHEAIDRAHMRGLGGAITHPAVMLRLDAVRRVGGYRQECNLAEDLDLFLRLAEIGRLHNLPEIHLEYRMHLASIGATKREQQRAAAARAVRDAHARRGIPLPELESIATRAARPQHEVLRTWAWWALAAGERRSARKHAWRGFRLRPFDREQLRVLLCALRGH